MDGTTSRFGDSENARDRAARRRGAVAGHALGREVTAELDIDGGIGGVAGRDEPGHRCEAAHAHAFGCGTMRM